ncbi:MAG: hypothetical protein ABF933_02130 [Leuconostoc citreum]
MATITINYMEILERKLTVQVPDVLSIDEQLEKAIQIGKQAYFAEEIVLNSNDLTSTEIQAVKNEYTTEFQAL